MQSPLLLRVAILLAVLPGCLAPDLEPPPAELPDEGVDCYTGVGDGAGDLYVAVLELEDAAGTTVIVVPMYHLASAQFYDEVQQELDQADVVLAEGVGGPPSLGMTLLLTGYVFSVARRLASFTDLVQQNEALSARPNWRNADLTMDAWSARMPWWSPVTQLLLFPFLVAGVEPITVTAWLTELVTRPVGGGDAFEAGWRHVIADTAGDEDGDDAELLLPGILTERNAHLLETFDHARAEAGVRRICIPWGAAHVPGLLEGLAERGFHETARRWLRVIPVRTLLAEGRPPAGDPTDVMVPYLFHWRSFREAWSVSLLLRSVLVEERPTSWRCELLWELLASAGGSAVLDAGSFQVLPSLFGRPILFEYARRAERTRWRFLLFFEIGSLESP